MSAKLLKNENAIATVSATAEAEAWKKAQANGFQKVKSKLKLAGFRDGKSIPDALAKSHIKQEEIYDAAINDILGKLYVEAIKELAIKPFDQPGVKVTKLSDSELEVEFEIPLFPEVTLGEYKGHKVKKEKVEVTDEDINAAIDALVKENANLQSVDREAKIGDTVVLDFGGFIDGKPFDGGSAKDYSLELGSNSFIPGFEEALVGLKAGDHKDVNVTFPTQYVAELAGKPAVFKCDIKEVKEKVYPTVDDEFAKSLNLENVASLEDLKTVKRAEILGKKESSATAKQLNAIIKEIVDASTVTMNELTVNREIEGMKENLKRQVEQNGLTLEQYMQITNNTEESLNAAFKAQAEANIKTYVVLEKIAEVENITVSDEEFEAELNTMATQYGMQVEQIKQYMGDQIYRLKDQIRQRKIEDFIKANNNM